MTVSDRGLTQEDEGSADVACEVEVEVKVAFLVS
jgi:hypothetical protein